MGDENTHPVESGFVTTDGGLKLYWKATGTGPRTLICCNGVGVSTFFWKFVAERFASEYRVVVWDYRGHGRSDRPHHPDAVDLPASPGELLIVDARLLHAAHANTSTEERTMMTLWYQPDVASLPERIQAQMHHKRHLPAENWPAAAKERWMKVLVDYVGVAEPYERQPYRQPTAPARSALH